MSIQKCIDTDDTFLYLNERPINPIYRLESKRPIIRYGDTVIISMCQSQSDQVYVSATK